MQYHVAPAEFGALNRGDRFAFLADVNRTPMIKDSWSACQVEGDPTRLPAYVGSAVVLLP